MKRYDLIVTGGGISGVAAATSAARAGLSVLLIEQTGTLGGAMSASLVYPFMRHTIRANGKRYPLSAGIFSEMKERFDALGEASWELYKIVFDELLEEAGAEVLFHAKVFSATTDQRRVTALQVATAAGILELEADYFIDASGDGELIAMTGCDYQLGRESDGFCQPMTTCFRMSGVDVKKFLEEEDRLQEIYKKYQAEGKLINPRENLLIFTGVGDGILHFNTTRVIKHDPTDPFDVSRAEMLARRQVVEMMDFMKENSTAFEHASLVYVANHIGVRESRKLKGVHILTADELKSCTDFEDTIALGKYDIDIHNPTGSGTYIYKFKEGEYYRIPYRSLLPKEYDNMLVAGRCASGDRLANSAYRVKASCMAMGQAAAACAVIALRYNQNIREADIEEIRTLLRENNAIVTADDVTD